MSQERVATAAMAGMVGMVGTAETAVRVVPVVPVVPVVLAVPEGAAAAEVLAAMEAPGVVAVPAAVSPGSRVSLGSPVNLVSPGNLVRNFRRCLIRRKYGGPQAMSRRRLGGLLWLALLCWACGILLLSALTPQELPEAAFLFSDKVNHFVAYAVGGWLAASTLRVSRLQGATVSGIVLAVIMVSVFGALDEMFQTFTPGRSGANIGDWTADFLGAVIGALVNLATHERLERLIRRP